MSAFETLNLTLGKLNSPSSLGSLLDTTFDIQLQLDTAITSKLGTQVGQIVGGVQALTQETDGAGDFVSGSGIVMLAENPPGVQVQKQNSALNADLSAITETDIACGGLLAIAIAANNPEAIAKMIKGVVGNISATALNEMMREISPAINAVQGKIDGVLTNIENGINGALGDVNAALNEALGGVNAAIGQVNEAISGALSLGESLPCGISAAVTTTPLIPPIGLGALGSIGGGALTEISNFQLKIGLDLNSGLADLLNGAATSYENSLPSLFSTVTNINAGENTGDESTVNSSVQVQSILAGASREITTVVVGCSNTFNDQDVRASNVPGWHFLITRTGELQEVTNINQPGDFNQNYNARSIGILFAGGLNTTLKEARGQDKLSFASAQSITREQFNTFDKFMTMFYSIFPHGQAVGNQDIDRDNSPFPGFDVGAYCKQRFNKDTIINPTKPAPSLSELEVQMNLNAQGVSDPGIEDEPNEGVQ
jgi:hypothetical protein